MTIFRTFNVFGSPQLSFEVVGYVPILPMKKKKAYVLCGACGCNNNDNKYFKAHSLTRVKITALYKQLMIKTTLRMMYFNKYNLKYCNLQ